MGVIFKVVLVKLGESGNYLFYLISVYFLRWFLWLTFLMQGHGSLLQVFVSLLCPDSCLGREIRGYYFIVVVFVLGKYSGV